MYQKKKNTAILIFANSSGEELKHKSIKKGTLLFDYFNKTTLKKVQKTGIPYFLYTEREQIGSTFGKRFTNAVKEVFELGFDKIVTIGNDSPLLKYSDIEQAANLLENCDSVIGPSTDGGTYLIGLKKEKFNAQYFESLPWQTKDLKNTLLQENIKFGLSQITLKYLDDIDSYEDLIRYKSKLYKLKREFQLLFKLIVDTLFIKIEIIFSSPSLFLKGTSYNKGSPLLVRTY